MADYVDASSHNGTLDLAAYWAAGHRDLMLKATEGTGYAWGQMQALARQWHSFGPDARCGYYHWLYANLAASEQHSWFWSHVQPVWRAGDWLMTDFEDVAADRQRSDAVTAAVLAGFNALCAAHGPVHTYTGNWFLASRPRCAAYLRTQLVVMSDYTNSPPANPYGLTYVAHQFTDRATVPGFPGPVDYNHWLTVEAASGSTATQLGGFMPGLTDQQQTDMAHQVGTTDAFVKSVYAWTQSILLRVASLGATVESQAASLTALQAAVTALSTASPGSVDPAALTALREAIDNLPAEVRALFASQPLTIGGTAR